MDMTKLMAKVKETKAKLAQKAKTLKPNPGDNRYIILPGWRKGEEWEISHTFGQHYIKDVVGEIKAVYPCNDATYGKSCAICDGISKAIRAASDEETVKTLEDAACGAKKAGYLVNVLALDSDEPNVPQILEIRPSAYRQLVDIIGSWGKTVFDPENPQIVILNRTGKGLLTKYTIRIDPATSAMPKGALAKIQNLDEYVAQENEDAQRRALGVINNVAGLLEADPRDKPKVRVDEMDESLKAFEKASVVRRDVALSDELDDLLGEMTA